MILKSIGSSVNNIIGKFQKNELNDIVFPFDKQILILPFTIITTILQDTL